MDPRERAEIIAELREDGYADEEIADILGEEGDLDWITNAICPYCKTGVLTRWSWWLECSKCDGRCV